MPLPKPHNDEKREDFMARCMADPATKEMQGTDEQRVAACERQFDEAKKDADLAEVYGSKAAADVSVQDAGQVRAVIACFDEVDNDGDVILAGAIPDGMKVVGSSYNHDTVFNKISGIPAPDAPPVSKGVIRIEGNKAVAYVDYFMDTQRGLEAFKTIKAMGADAKWSFSYRYDERPTRATGTWAQKGARRVITKLGPLLDGTMEISPVKMPGNSNTGTISAKGATVDTVDQHGVDASSPEPSVAKKSADDVTTELRLARTRRLLGQ